MKILAKERNARFVLELDLMTEVFHEHILEKRFELSRQMLNRTKGYLMKQLRMLRADADYEYWLKQPASKERSEKLTELREQYNVSKSGAERFVAGMSQHFKSVQVSDKQRKKSNRKNPPAQKVHIDSLVAQKVAERAWKSVSAVLFGKGKTVHFTKYGQMDSVEGKTNTSGIRYVEGNMVWNGS